MKRHKEIDERLYALGLAALEERLGAAEAMRFLGQVSQRGFDYVAWRDRAFAGESVANIFKSARARAQGRRKSLRRRARR